MADQDPKSKDPRSILVGAFAEGLQPMSDILQEILAATKSRGEESKKSLDMSNRSFKSSNDNAKQQRGLLASVVQNISLPLPGGARLFGLSSFMDKIDESRKKLTKANAVREQATKDAAEMIDLEADRLKGGRDLADQINQGIRDQDDETQAQKDAKGAYTKQQHAQKAAVLGLTAMVTALVLVTEGLRALGKSLGGVSEGQAFSEMMAAIGTSFTGLISGKGLRSPMRTLQMQGAAGQEFGQLLTSTAAAEMGDVVTRFGITVQQMAKLERTFQATAMGSREALQSFAEVGILGQTAATELAANAGAVARAGDNFNEFIVAGIKNAKVLGLEFSKMESTLTGFTMDFEGTVTGFSELRAVIPGMATDFGQLLSTAMTGTTDEYTAQIRSSLLGAGIGSASDLNRQQAALLEKATGFSADQIDRILKGEALDANIQQDLTKKTNWLLILQMGILGAILGATIAGVQGWLKVAGAVVGAKAGLAIGVGAGFVGALGGVDDAFISKEGEVTKINDNDDILLSKSGFGGDSSAVISALGRIENILSQRQVIDLRGGQAFVERHSENAYQGQLRTA